MLSSSLRMCFIQCILTIILLGFLTACEDESDELPGGLKRDDVSFEILPGDTDETVTDVELFLAWLPHPDQSVTGYLVYYGPTLDATTMVISDLSINSNKFDLQVPSVTYKAWDDLRLRSNDSICFRLKAYNSDGQSELSPGACVRI